MLTYYTNKGDIYEEIFIHIFYTARSDTFT